MEKTFFDKRLVDGEEVVTLVKPYKGSYLASFYIILLLFSLLLLIGSFIGCSIRYGSGPYLLAWFVYAALYCLVLVPFLCIGRVLCYKGYGYCITNKRILLKNSISNKQCETINIEQIDKIVVKKDIFDKMCNKTCGSIKLFFKENGTQESCFDFIYHISNPNDVFEKIKQINKSVQLVSK